ncbi:MAG TPA: hypothetical protein VJX73_09370 [Terracidiphilus sp.]|nr:hypothetical protein [Terracidiphilus sp.]
MLLVTLAATALPALAAQRETVAELQQFLTAQDAAHKSDGSIADHLGEMELSEQLTEPTLDRITAVLKLQKKTAQALQLLADQSAFLEPPAGEIPAKSTPEMAEQVRLIQGAVDFASVTIEKMPDFLATRTTHTFDNSVLSMTPDASRVGFVAGGPLHANGEYSRQITYRAGAEVSVDAAVAPDKQEKHSAAPQGLTSTGEFGPFLQIILSDSAKGQVVWSHWEQTRTGLAAVFRYQVPQEASHYTVDFCCVLIVAHPPATGGKVPTKGEVSLTHFHGYPGYHGYLYLDSETGAVLRVTLEADFVVSGSPPRLGEWVEYGMVKIGERDYLCPVRSTAFTHLFPWRVGEPGFMNLNEVTFTNYHRFGSTARILAAPPEP